MTQESIGAINMQFSSFKEFDLFVRDAELPLYS